MGKDLILGNYMTWSLGNTMTEISNKFASLENFSDNDDRNRAWENIEEDIKTLAKDSLGLHELKQYRPWFDEECFKFFFFYLAG
jgi:hypothetical protein